MSEQAVVLVTGAGGGIGAAIAHEIIAAGDVAVALDLAFTNETPSEARRIVCDVTSKEAVSEAVDRVARELGQIDALVNAAGIMRVEESGEMTEANALATHNVHWLGAAWMAQAAFPYLRNSENPAIVNISSVAGISGMPKRLSYNAAKAGIDAMTRTLAVEWAPHGIRVNSVAPGYITTRMTGDLIEAGTLKTKPITDRTPLGRFAAPSEIAKPVVFLLSESASFITGHVLYVDGGLTIDGNWY